MSGTPVWVASQDEVGTPLGRVSTAAFVTNAPVALPRPRRVLDSYALVLVHEGEGSYEDDANPRRTIEPGDAIVVVPGHPHWYGPSPGTSWSEIFLIFDGPVFDALAAGGVLTAREPVRRAVPQDAWRERLRRFARRPRASDPVERQMEILELAALLTELRGGEVAHDRLRPIGRARELLAADLAGQVDLHDVAESVDLPYETFRKRFREATGVAPAAYRMDRRIEAAKTLLRTTTMTHAAIAASLGFADEYHFGKRFRARVGVSPRRFRVDHDGVPVLRR